MNTLNPRMHDQSGSSKSRKKHAPYQNNKTFVKAYQNHFAGQNNDNVPEEKPKPYRVYTTVLNMPVESESES